MSFDTNDNKDVNYANKSILEIIKIIHYKLYFYI